MRSIFSILLIIIIQSVFGQTGNYTSFSGRSYDLFFDDAKTLNWNGVYIRNVYSLEGHALSNYDGSLRLIAGSQIYNHKKGNLTTNLTTYRYENTLRSRIVEINDTTLLVFEVRVERPNGSIQPSVLRKSVVRGNRNALSIEANEHRMLQSTDSIYGIAVIEDTIGGDWLIVRNGGHTFSSYYFSNDTTHDRVVHSILPPLYDPLFKSTGTLNRRSRLIQSPAGNYIAVKSEQSYEDPITETLLQNKSEIDILRFDKNTGLLSYESQAFTVLDTGLYSSYIGNEHGSFGLAFSSNEEFLYYSYNITKPRGGSNGSIDSFYLKKYSLAREINKIINSEVKYGKVDRTQYNVTGFYDIKLFNNREILLSRVGYINGGAEAFYVFDAILESGTSEATLIQEKYKFAKNRGYTSGSRFAYSKYNYIDIKPKYMYDCKAHITFRDKCDYALSNTKVTYYSEDEAGSGVLVSRGQNPTIDYNENGNYLCKAVLKSHEGTYKEIHYDTIRVRIPPKPVPAFTAVDTIVCAFATAEFINGSFTDTIHPINGEKWVWTFGDGESVSHTERSRSASHVYEKSGTYTVSLFYSNGFCDSTLTKNQYITVVDAPAPGFSIDNNRGCSPFTVNITDTITVNTTKKEYNYYDGRGWVNVPVNQQNFKQTYQDAGNYWITQRLYGYTGCITQLDSVRIYVTPGFTQTDTIHILQATYLDHPSMEGALTMHSGGKEEWRNTRVDTREPISVLWSTHPAAVRYSLSRNGAEVARLEESTAQTLDSVDRPRLYSYSIVGIDSCGTSSASGRKVNPIYLTGAASEDNSMAVVQFSPYTESLVEMEYSLFEEIDGNWNLLSNLGRATYYTDNEFLKIGGGASGTHSLTSLEKCYVIATQSGELSNVLCLPYKPTMFIPTAFTPNDDGLNDVYRPVTFGIEFYQVKVYNRYGQLIADFNQDEKGWEAENAAIGGYMVTIRAKGTDNNWYNEKSTVTVLR